MERSHPTVVVKITSTGNADILRFRSPRIKVGSITRTFTPTGRWYGWHIESSGGHWWANTFGSFAEARDVARKHFANIYLDGKH